jgi:RNA polymerase sigma-70 factor (ECF subfamily)
MPNPANEERLVTRLRMRDRSAVADLESVYGSRIHQLAFRYLKNHEDAEEVTQDVLLKVYDKIGAFRGDSALSSWIYRITFNAAMSKLRAARARYGRDGGPDLVKPRQDADRPAAAVDVPDWSTLADERVLRGELHHRFMRALANLPRIYRVPVMLRDVKGLTTEEASRLLRVKTQTLKSRLHRGRLILRDQLGDFETGLTLHQAA